MTNISASTDYAVVLNEECLVAVLCWLELDFCGVKEIRLSAGFPFAGGDALEAVEETSFGTECRRKERLAGRGGLEDEGWLSSGHAQGGLGFSVGHDHCFVLIGGTTAPPEMMTFMPSATDIFRRVISSSGSMRRNPLVGLGVVGTNILTIFSPVAFCVSPLAMLVRKPIT